MPAAAEWCLPCAVGFAISSSSLGGLGSFSRSVWLPDCTTTESTPMCVAVIFVPSLRIVSPCLTACPLMTACATGWAEENSLEFHGNFHHRHGRRRRCGFGGGKGGRQRCGARGGLGARLRRREFGHAERIAPDLKHETAIDRGRADFLGRGRGGGGGTEGKLVAHTEDVGAENRRKSPAKSPGGFYSPTRSFCADLFHGAEAVGLMRASFSGVSGFSNVSPRSIIDMTSRPLGVCNRSASMRTMREPFSSPATT